MKARSIVSIASWLLALLLWCGAAPSAWAQTTSCGTCRNPNDAQDTSYCDLATNQCVYRTAACAPFFVDAQGNENKCQPNYGRDAQTGQCLYRPKVCFNRDGCFNSACNPRTGDCELVADDPRAIFTCGRVNELCRPFNTNGNVGGVCQNNQCNYYVCDPAVSSENCATFVPVNCNFANVSSCQTPLPRNDAQGISEFGCQGGAGCVFSATACSPPSDPCQELVRNPNEIGCCTYQPRNCAAEYGNNPNFNYSCDPTARNGVCVATSAQPPVLYNWSGFFQPVDNPPTVNSVKAGSGVPVKFSLGANYGLDVIAAGYPLVQTVSCSSGAIVAEIETVTSGSSGLSYDAASNRYTYVWKTQKGWGGTCATLVLKLKDGSEHRASFSFK